MKSLQDLVITDDDRWSIALCSLPVVAYLQRSWTWSSTVIGDWWRVDVTHLRLIPRMHIWSTYEGRVVVAPFSRASAPQPAYVSQCTSSATGSYTCMSECPCVVKRFPIFLAWTAAKQPSVELVVLAESKPVSPLSSDRRDPWDLIGEMRTKT